jgi:hypothetical protein
VSYLIDSLKIEDRSSRPKLLAGVSACGRCRSPVVPLVNLPHIFTQHDYSQCFDPTHALLLLSMFCLWLAHMDLSGHALLLLRRATAAAGRTVHLILLWRLAACKVADEVIPAAAGHVVGCGAVAVGGVGE